MLVLCSQSLIKKHECISYICINMMQYYNQGIGESVDEVERLWNIEGFDQFKFYDC